MTNQMAIRLSDGPVDKHVRVQTEQTGWDEPSVRYIKRKEQTHARPSPLHIHKPDSSEDHVLTFGNVQVHIHADEDQIRIVLNELHKFTRAA